MKSKMFLRYAWTNFGLEKLMEEVNSYLDQGWVVTNFLSIGKLRPLIFLDLKKLEKDELEELKDYNTKDSKMGFHQ